MFSNVSLILLLLAGILTIRRRGYFRLAAIGLVLLTVIVRIMSLFLDLPALFVPMLALTGVCYTLFVCVIALKVLTRDQSHGTGSRSVALYLFIAVLLHRSSHVARGHLSRRVSFSDEWRPRREPER